MWAAAEGGPWLFATEGRPQGTAFYALSQSTGELRYQLDGGPDIGRWIPFGKRLSAATNGPLGFAVLPREDGRAFFAVDLAHGQVHYLLDYGPQPGVWNTYGPPADSPGPYQFRAEKRRGGTAFFLMDARTGQISFMVDYGTEAGRWKPFGSKLP